MLDSAETSITSLDRTSFSSVRLKLIIYSVINHIRLPWQRSIPCHIMPVSSIARARSHSRMTSITGEQILHPNSRKYVFPLERKHRRHLSRPNETKTCNTNDGIEHKIIAHPCVRSVLRNQSTLYFVNIIV